MSLYECGNASVGAKGILYAVVSIVLCFDVSVMEKLPLQIDHLSPKSFLALTAWLNNGTTHCYHKC